MAWQGGLCLAFSLKGRVQEQNRDRSNSCLWGRKSRQKGQEKQAESGASLALAVQAGGASGSAAPAPAACAAPAARVLEQRSVELSPVNLAPTRTRRPALVSASHKNISMPQMAPELLLGRACTEKVDIYSFGVTMWEMCAGGLRHCPFSPLAQRSKGHACTARGGRRAVIFFYPP